MTMGNGNSNPYGNPHRKEAGEILTDTERDVILSELCGGMSQLLDKERDSAAQHTIPRTLRLGLSPPCSGHGYGRLQPHSVGS